MVFARRKCDFKKVKHSDSVHVSRATSHHRPAPVFRRIILVVIFSLILVVFFVFIYAILSDDERLVKSKIAEISADYYENHFYENAISDVPESELSSVMEKYEKYGFSKVTLRQLLLYDNQKNADEASYLTAHCDEERTYVTFFPESPYGKTNYHSDYYYVCEF